LFGKAFLDGVYICDCMSLDHKNFHWSFLGLQVFHCVTKNENTYAKKEADIYMQESVY